MKRNKTKYDRWLRMLFLSFALLTGGGVGMVWGQTTEGKTKISLTWDNQKHDNVHTEEKTIYVQKGKNRVLSIPVLNVNARKTGDDSYNWFVHWYVKNNSNTTTGTISHHSFTVTNSYAGNRGGSISADAPGFDKTKNEYVTKDHFVKVEETNGLIWSKRLKERSVTPTFDNHPGLGIDASTIAYSEFQEGDIVYCDVSVYQDGTWSPASTTYTEPTLLKRYKYVIKKAEECPSYKNEVVNYNIDFPKDAPAINLFMPYAPDNYFWGKGSNVCQGTEFEYQIDDSEFKKFHLTTKNATLDKQQTQRIIIDDKLKGKDFKVKIKAICNETSSDDSKVIAIFNFHPIENAQFMLESDFTSIDKQNHDRWPRGNTQKYKQIGHVSFDQSEKDKLPTALEKGNNMSDSPLGSFSDSETSYGFIYKDGQSLLESSTCYTSYPGMYGLFRSANVVGVSKHGDNCSSTSGVNRKYKWLTPLIDNANYKNPQYQNTQLYDRTYSVTNEEGNAKYGYFYYIDATDEPGTLVSVPIDGTICDNTELTVTGWLADMTRPGCDIWTPGLPLPLAPNLNVILKGKNAQGEDVVLHRFTTGDALTNYSINELNYKNSQADREPNNPNRTKFNLNLMQWQQFHYKFVVPKEELADCVDGKFYLEIQNNEPHTDGADYAIDDIRIFRRKPEVSIIQAGNLCDTKVKTVQYVSSYSNIMTVMGLEEGEVIPKGNINRDVNWEETPQELKDYILKTKTDEQAREYVESHFTKVYYSVYEYDEQTKGPKDNPLLIDYDGDGKKEYYRMSFLSTVKEDMKWVDPSFNSEGKDAGDKIYSLPLEIGGSFNPETKYIARISSQPLEDGNIGCGDCALTGDPFQLSVAGDRFTIFGGDDLNTEISSPENAEQGKKYKIAGRFSYLDDGTWKELEDAKFDWFIGTLEEFNTLKVTLSEKEYTIAQLLPTISTSTEVASQAIIEALTNQYGVYGTDNTSGKFVFTQHNFEYTMANKYQTIIGLPHALQNDGTEIGKNLYCPDPVVIQLGPTPPTIDPGDPDTPDPNDPEDPKDPDPKDPEDPDKPQPDDWNGKHVRSVRVMLTQILDMQTNGGTLRIPIHFRKSAEEEKFAVNQQNNKIMVVKTSDPNWNVNKEVATLTELADQYIDLKSTDNNTPKWNTHYFKIKFEANNGFREGFWYMVDIPYQVVDNKPGKVYEGSMKLTLKIVPEYVTWVGSAENMHNWNNDGPSHWRRSKNSELYMGNDNETNGAQVNGTHNEAYTPMRFTKVTIYGKAQKTENGYNADGEAYAAYPYLYQLKKQTTGGLTNLLDMAPADMDAGIGAATKNIEYDLLADPDYEKELFGNDKNPDKADGTENHYACVRFYGNTCNEIYIKPESEILHTEFLTYNKAHVDYEMAPNRWYMLASPLKGVVSGDMYLPTGTSNVGKYARQETPAFTDITYGDNTSYTRWKPAVYMRGWDKASAIVVRPGTSSNNQVNYGIKSSWSNLYNDVDVPFTPGTGFSIGTKTDGTTALTNSKVLFRLPKADNKYTYYGSTTGSGDKKTLTNRSGNGRFHISPDEKGQKAVTSCSASSTGGMFGNPFMSHLNMEEFLNGKSQNTYYIMTATGTTTNILGDGYSISTSDVDPKFVAPLQSFIVPNLASATFNTDMIAKAPTTGNIGLRSATVAPAEEHLPQLRITATRDGIRNTAVVAGLATASDSYVEGEDAALLINEEVAAPQVYTLAGNQMVAINVTPDLAEIPVGIHGKDATPVELSFKLSGAMKNVKLVDKQTGKRYDVTDGLTLTVPGNTYGRYFLNGSIATSNEIIARNHIIFYNSAPGRIDVSSVDALSEVTVYDIAGRALRTLRNLNTPTASVDHLAPGIYVVRAESGSQVVSEKVEVK